MFNGIELGKTIAFAFLSFDATAFLCWFVVSLLQNSATSSAPEIA